MVFTKNIISGLGPQRPWDKKTASLEKFHDSLTGGHSAEKRRDITRAAT